MDAFGELIYVVAMADGTIQDEELKTIEEKLKYHKWGRDIQWSFNYEMKKGSSPEEVYYKVLSYCESYGPAEEYQFLIEILEDVAKSSNGIDAQEEKVMNDFVNDLTERFKRDVARING